MTEASDNPMNSRIAIILTVLTIAITEGHVELANWKKQFVLGPEKHAK